VARSAPGKERHRNRRRVGQKGPAVLQGGYRKKVNHAKNQHRFLDTGGELQKHLVRGEPGQLRKREKGQKGDEGPRDLGLFSRGGGALIPWRDQGSGESGASTL